MKKDVALVRRDANEPATDIAAAAMAPAKANRTLERAKRRHETHVKALIGTVDVADVAQSGLDYLGRGSIRRQVGMTNYGNDQVRAQEFAVDQEIIDKIVQQTIRIHNEEQQRLYRLASQELRKIAARPLLVEDTRGNGQRVKDQIISALTDGMEDA